MKTLLLLSMLLASVSSWAMEVSTDCIAMNGDDKKVEQQEVKTEPSKTKTSTRQ